MSLITEEALVAIAPEADAEIIASLLEPLNVFLPQFGIVSPNRVSMFIAQWAEETDSFRTMVEYASGEAYDNRKDLGNGPTDGPRYRGRGLPMLTGKDNYILYGKLLGVDLVDNPEKAAEPSISVHIACLYWQQKGLNAWADKGDVMHCTYLINGGENGEAQRQLFYDRALKVFANLTWNNVPAAEGPMVPSPIAANPTTPIWKTPEASLLGSAAIGQVGMIFSGGVASGPLAWALAFVIVAATVAGLYYLWKRLHQGQK